MLWLGSFTRPAVEPAPVQRPSAHALSMLPPSLSMLLLLLLLPDLAFFSSLAFLSPIAFFATSPSFALSLEQAEMPPPMADTRTVQRRLFNDGPPAVRLAPPPLTPPPSANGAALTVAARTPAHRTRTLAGGARG